MKKVLIMVSFLALAVASCKKDYPDDIPQWVKDKIKSCKYSGCYYTGGSTLTISELKNITDGSLIIEYSGQMNPAAYYYFDYSGNPICEGGSSLPGINCNRMIDSIYVFNRIIWHEVSYYQQWSL